MLIVFSGKVNVSLESSIHKVHVYDVSNVHVYSTTLLNVQWYSRASIGKYFVFRIEISQGILVLSVRHHTLISGADTLVRGSKLLFRSQDVFVVWHGLFELCFIDTFMLNFTCPGLSLSGNFSVQYDLLKRPIILSPLNSTLKSPGVRLPWCTSGVRNQLCLFHSNFSRSSGLIKSSTFSAVIPR